MKKHLTTILLIAVFIIGICLVLYPTVSDMVNKAHQSVAIDNYDKQVAEMGDTDYNEALAQARKYNSLLTGNEFPKNSEDLEGNAEYNAACNPSGDGMMGYLEIPVLGVKMPVYHTTKESVLQAGIGHIPTTSLPVGGEGSHAVLTGHRGLPSAKLFTDLDKMEKGDIFYIYVLGDVLAYETDQIKTVLPTDTRDLQIEKDKDYVTLVTCTPYGINTHRLLIRGKRIPYEEANEIVKESNQTVKRGIDYEKLILVIGLPILCMIFILALLKKGKRRKTA